VKPTKKPSQTPLARSLGGNVRQTPLTLFERATAKWLKGERLDLSELANELGVARTTIFRWVGTREQLYGEVLSAVYGGLRAEILRTTPGQGLERLERVTRRTLNALANAAPLRTFLAQDPEFAIHVLTSKSSPVQDRSVRLEVELLREVMREANIEPRLDIETLAFVIVRIAEAFLYADVMSGRKPEIEKAVAAISILAGAEPRRTKASPAQATSSRRKRRS